MPGLKFSVHAFEAKRVTIRQNWMDRDAAVAFLACSVILKILKIWPEQHVKEALCRDMEVNVVYSVCTCATERDVKPEAFIATKNQADENYFN